MHAGGVEAPAVADTAAGLYGSDDFLELLLVLVQSLKLPSPNDRAASL